MVGLYQLSMASNECDEMWSFASGCKAESRYGVLFFNNLQVRDVGSGIHDV